MYPKQVQTRWVILPSDQNVLEICLTRNWTVWWPLEYYNQKHFGGERVYFSGMRVTITEGSQGRNSSRAGTWGQEQAKATEEHCSLACPTWLARPAFLYTPGPSTQVWHLQQWAGPCDINLQSRKCPPGLSIGRSDRDIFLIEVSSSENNPKTTQKTIASVKLT